MKQDAKAREEEAMESVSSYVFVRTDKGGMKLVECKENRDGTLREATHDDFYDLAGDALNSRPQRPSMWYMRSGAVAEDGTIKRRTIDDLTAAEKEAVENPSIRRLRTITGGFRRVYELIAEPAYK